MSDEEGIVAPAEMQEHSTKEAQNDESPSPRPSHSAVQAMAESGYSKFFQADAATMLRTMNEIERKLRDVHATPQWATVVFAKLKKLDELEEVVHKLELTTPVDTLDELFRTKQVERYTAMLRDEYLSKEGTVASELYARVQVLELEQERLQKLLAARPTVTDMQVLKDLHLEHVRSLERQFENSHSDMKSHLQELFAAELEEFHKWRQSQEAVLHAKLTAMQSDMGTLSSARDEQRTAIDDIRTNTSQNLDTMISDMTAFRKTLEEQMAALQSETSEVITQTAATRERADTQQIELAQVTTLIESRLREMEKKATELDQLMNAVQSKAREDVLDVKKIAQVSRANMLELVARQDTIEESIEQTKQEMKQEDGKLLDLIGGLTIEVRSSNEGHSEARSQIEQKLSNQLSNTREKLNELSIQASAMSQDVGNMLMAVGGMPGQINALEIHMRQVTEEVTDSLVRMDKLEGAGAEHQARLEKFAESLEDLRDGCFRLKEANVQIDLTLEDTYKKLEALQSQVLGESEQVQGQILGLETGAEAMASSLSEFQTSITGELRQGNDKAEMQLQKLTHDIDKLRRIVEDMPTASPLTSKKSMAARLKSITSAPNKASARTDTTDGESVMRPSDERTSGRRPGSSAAKRPPSGNHSARTSPPASRGKARSDGLPAVAGNTANDVSSGSERPKSGNIGGVGGLLSMVDMLGNDGNKTDEEVDLDVEEDEGAEAVDAIQDAIRFFGDLCLSFEDIAVRKTAIPELNPALCDQITAVAQETSNQFAATADAEIISRVLRAKPSEVTYDDMISERRIALLSNFQTQIEKYVEQNSSAAAGIIRLEARELFLRKVRAALDISMSKHEQVLVAAHSRLGRMSIPTCIACDRPLLNRHRHLQQRSMFGDDMESNELAEGSFSSLGRYDDESLMPIPTKDPRKTAPQQPVQIMQNRPHTTSSSISSSTEKRFTKRGSGFRMNRPTTRSLDVIPSPVSSRSPVAFAN